MQAIHKDARGPVFTASNAYRGDEPADRYPYDRPAQHVARIVHAHVDARLGDGHRKRQKSPAPNR